MRIIENETLLRERAATPDGKALLRAMRENADWWSEHFSDSPETPSGWGHVYFCGKCGTFLTFDRSSPRRHACPNCANVETGPDYDASWVYLYRYEAVMAALQAAVLYRLEGRADDLELYRRIVGFYAENWYKFAEHGRRVWPSGLGKITPQALNEAIFLVRVLLGLELLGEAAGAEFLDNLKTWFLLPCAYFLDAQKRKIHNIPCWLNAAVGWAGLYAENADLVARAFDKPFGFLDQVRNGGVSRDYFWYEGSIHYNFFTLESFLCLMLSARLHGREIPADVERTVREMLIAPCKYAFSNGVLPNPNDGWPNLSLKTYSFLYEMGARIFPDGEIAALARRIRQMPGKRIGVPLSSPFYAGDAGLEWLLFGGGEEGDAPDYLAKSWNFPDSCFATLKNGKIELFQKYGHLTESHAHPDKMTQEIWAFGRRVTHDLSNCGYAAKLCPEYHRTGVSHNTVLIDGRNHPTVGQGECLAFDESRIDTRYREAYPGVDFRRTAEITARGFSDTFTVECAEEHSIDWIYHYDGALLNAPGGVPSDTSYAYLLEPVKTDASGEIILHWDFDGLLAEQRLAFTGELYLCKSWDNPAREGEFRTALLVRTRGKNASVAQSWSFTEGLS